MQEISSHCNLFTGILQIAAEVAAPLSSCDKIVMVSNGDGDVGAGKITNEILDIVAKLPKAVESLTGVDISKVLLGSFIFPVM